MGINDNRLDKRLTGFWRAFKDGLLWGYVVDISNSGIKLVLNKKEHIPKDTFKIELSPPDSYGMEFIEVSLKTAWSKKVDESFEEVGCYFIDLTLDQENIINKLVNFFEGYDKGH